MRFCSEYLIGCRIDGEGCMFGASTEEAALKLIEVLRNAKVKDLSYRQWIHGGYAFGDVQS